MAQASFKVNTSLSCDIVVSFGASEMEWSSQSLNEKAWESSALTSSSFFPSPSNLLLKLCSGLRWTANPLELLSVYRSVSCMRKTHVKCEDLGVLRMCSAWTSLLSFGLCRNFFSLLASSPLHRWTLAYRSPWIADLVKEVLLWLETQARLLGVMGFCFALPLVSRSFCALQEFHKFSPAQTVTGVNKVFFFF